MQETIILKLEPKQYCLYSMKYSDLMNHIAETSDNQEPQGSFTYVRGTDTVAAPWMLPSRSRTLHYHISTEGQTRMCKRIPR